MAAFILLESERKHLEESGRCAACNHLKALHTNHCCMYCNIEGCPCEGVWGDESELQLQEMRERWVNQESSSTTGGMRPSVGSAAATLTGVRILPPESQPSAQGK